MQAPKGLLKAFITDANRFEFNTDRANQPDRYGCTLLYLDGSEFYDEWDGTEDIDSLIAHLDGREIDLEIHYRLVASKTTALICTPHIDDEVPGFSELDRYVFPHHITEGWDDGCNPVDAAKEAKEYQSRCASEYWEEVETATMEGADYVYPDEEPGAEFLRQKGWTVEDLNPSILVRGRIEWKPFLPRS